MSEPQWITLDELAKRIAAPKRVSILAPSNWSEQVKKMYWVDGFGKFFYLDSYVVKECKIRQNDLMVQTN